jgi:O-antigen/teichoic acid export membrane protein
MVIVSIILFLFVLLSQLTGLSGFIWPEQTMLFIQMAAFWGILDWIFRIFNQMSDAFGLTVSAEKTKVLQKFIGMLFILILFYSNQLFLINYFYYQYFILLFIIIALTLIIKKSGYSVRQSIILKLDQIKAYTREFWNYSSPLIVVALSGLIVGIFDRWLLQVYGGSAQQGFYGLSFQIGAICFLFTSAMTPLLLREFSIAYSNKDLPQMAVLFRRYVPMLYSIAAYFSCFIALQADKVVYLFGGKNFKEASLSLVIMAFFPLHQTYGQLSSSVFYASGQTKLYRNISIFFNLIGIPILFFLIAPKDKFGLETGAVGLSIKMVLLQFVGVNVSLYYNTKLLQITYWKYLGHQIISVLSLLIFSYMSIFLVDNIFNLNQNYIISFLISGFIYTLLAGTMIYFQPIIFGLSKKDIRSIIKEGFYRFKDTLKRY